uniref:pyridoxal 5'-phosphate synthase (glutamine hydrolyzing) n=1 Tax=Colletotrichum fructicola (strain Nara gc5) TaxID=1213859 RepID=L2FTU7_COLFN
MTNNDATKTNGDAKSSFAVKAGLAQMLKGGVIMDVVNAEQARIAEEAGACAVMALERVPADIRKDGGVARMSDPAMIREIQNAVTIPVMAKARIGHFVECQILEALGIDYIDESEVLTPADKEYHVEKHDFKAPFGEAGTGDVVEAVTHVKQVTKDIAQAKAILQTEGVLGLRAFARKLEVDPALLQQTAELGRLPVLGGDGVFVGSGIFKSGDPVKRAKAIVRATTHYKDPKVLAECSEGLGEAMVGINCDSMKPEEKMAGRGW